MEKFGLFNLISALASFAGEENKDKNAENAGQNAEKNGRETESAGAGLFTPEQRINRCTQILERHERISRSVDRKNKP